MGVYTSSLGGPPQQALSPVRARGRATLSDLSEPRKREWNPRRACVADGVVGLRGRLRAFAHSRPAYRAGEELSGRPSRRLEPPKDHNGVMHGRGPRGFPASASDHARRRGVLRLQDHGRAAKGAPRRAHPARRKARRNRHMDVEPRRAAPVSDGRRRCYAGRRTFRRAFSSRRCA
jgi:hypothetical protein